MIKVGSKKKVFVGMSGGVDSSVSAALLLRAGYEVTGVFIKVWQPDWITCTWREDRLDAMRVAAQLGIKFVTLDLEETYKREVVDYMIAEYRAGRTPNPDVMCNRHVKFGGFFKWAMEQGADYVATGHYAKVSRSAKLPGSSEVFSLLAGDDTNKDQSYFLWTLGQKELSHTLFPVGDLPKPEVRRLARTFGLPNAEKKDSQGLCFIGKIDIKDFLSRYIPVRPGNVLDAQSGEIIGQHDGAWFYTIGERHGFSIDAGHKTPHDNAYYVVSKDIEKNTISITDKSAISSSDTRPFSQKVEIGQLNWIGGDIPKTQAVSTTPADHYFARTRYRESLQPIQIMSSTKRLAVVAFENLQQTITSGQSLVIYKKTAQGLECIGGGIIN